MKRSSIRQHLTLLAGLLSCQAGVAAGLPQAAPQGPLVSLPAIPGSQVSLARQDYLAVAGDGTLSIPRPRVTLPSIRLEDIASTTKAARPSGRVVAGSRGFGLSANAGISVPPLPPVIRREIPGAWVLAQRASSPTITSPHVEAFVSSTAGMQALANENGSHIPARLTSHHRTRSVSADLSVHEGSLILEIPTVFLLESGRYSGTISLFPQKD